MFSSARVGSLSTTTTTTTTTTIPSSVSNPLLGCSVSLSRKSSLLQTLSCTLKVSSVVVATSAEKAEVAREDFSVGREDSSVGTTSEAIRQARRSADWKAARAHKESGAIYQGKIEGFNGGGLLVRFYSLLGFLPYPLLSPSHLCKEPQKTLQEVAKDLVGSLMSVKVIQATEENRKLIFSEKEASWSIFAGQVNVGDVYEARVGSVEDYGAFVHLRFPDGYYHITGLVHVSEVSWDLVQDVRDILNIGDEVKVKVIEIDRERSRVTLSIKQLEGDPLLETLYNAIPQDGTLGMDSSTIPEHLNITPLPELDNICIELLKEDGITEVRIGREGFEKRVVSQDLQLWLSNHARAADNQFTILARAGRQVQEVHLTTTLDHDGIKKALQRVLERVP